MTSSPADQSNMVDRPWPQVSSAGLFLALLAATAFSTEGVLGKLVLESGATAPAILAVRFGIAALVLWAFDLALRRAGARLKPGPRRIRGLPPLPFHGLAFMGSVLYAATTLFIFLSLERIPSGLTLTILYIYPILVAVGSSVLGDEKLTRAGVVAGVLGFAGVVAVGSPSIRIGGDVGMGVAFALLAALVNASQLIYTNRLIRHHQALRVTRLYLAYGALVMGLLTVVLAAVKNPTTRSLGAATLLAGLWREFSLLGQHPVSMGALALVPTALAAICLMLAIRTVGAPRTSLVATSEPPLALALGAVFLGERFATIQLVGATMIVVAILLLFLSERGSQNKKLLTPGQEEPSDQELS